MPVKKGLVAPQNIFIQTIIKKFDGSPDRNFVLGNAQVDDLPIIYCNDGFCELTGYKRAELVQRHCSCDFLCGEDTSEVAARAVKEALHGTEEKHVEILYYRKDGSQFLCSVLIAPVKNEDGMAVMYIINHEDVTWSPNKDEVSLPYKSCFQFPLNMNKIPAAIRRKKREGDVLGTDDDEEDSAKSSRVPETHITSYPSSGNSDLDSPNSPSCVPMMSVLPPTPPRSTEAQGSYPSSLFAPETSESARVSSPKASSMFDISKNSNTESESLIKPMASVALPCKAGNMLYIPDSFKGRLSAAVSESSLWNARGRPWSDGHNVDLRGSTIITSPVLNMHPRKTEKVAQVMSLGADVLPEYKLQAPKIHPWTILHYSPFKAFWDWLILFLVIYTAILTPYVASFVLSKDKLADELNKNPETRKDSGPVTIYSDPLVIVDYIVDVMFIVDIFINFRTTFVDCNDEVVSHPCRIAIHYFKTWFVIDLVAAIPFELLFMIGNTNQTTTLIGLLKTARLLRLVRVARKLDHYSEYGMAVLCLLMCSFALLAHWLACIWYFIGNIERDDKNTIGWLDSLADQVNQPYNKSDPTSGPDMKSKYVTALYFTLSSLTSVGFGNVSPNTNIEKIFSICIMLVGSLFYAAIFGNVAAIIARLYSSTSRYHAQMSKVREFIRFYQIPNPLRQRVEDYAHHVWSYTNGIDMDQVLKHFPECLQADICLHLNSGLLHTYPAFSTAPHGCLRALALKIKTTHLPPGDYIVYQGDEVNQLYFVLRGTVEVLDGDVIMAILGKGDSFGENFVIDPDRPLTISTSSIRALTYCDLRMISREDILHILGQYPQFRDNFIRDLEVTFNLRGIDGDKRRTDSEKDKSFSSNDSSPVFARQKTPDAGKVKEPLLGPVTSGKEGKAPKQTSNHVDHTEKRTLAACGISLHVTDAKSRESELSELRPPVVELESRTPSTFKTSSVGFENNEEPANCSSAEEDTEPCCPSVCKNCCKSFKQMEAKLENLSSCLQRLETKLTSDVEAIFELLKSHHEAKRVKKLDLYTQV